MADNTPGQVESGWRRLVSNALMVALAGGFANVLNLGVTTGVARILKPHAYGAYGQMVGVFTVVALSGSALGVAVVRRAGYYIVRSDHVLTLHWQRRLHQRVALAAGVCAVAALPVSFVIASWLGHRSWVAVWLIGVSGLIFAVLSVDRALLQSYQRYGALANNFVFEGVVRTVFTLAGVQFGVTGYAAGLLIAELLTRAHAYRMVRTRVDVDPGMEIQHTGITKELVVAFATLAFMAVLQFIDVFVIGHDNKNFGSYTAISTIAKILVFGAVILNSFLLPEAVLASRKGAEAVRQLALVLALLAVASLAFVVLATFFSHAVLKLVFGAQYAHASSSLLPLVLAMVALSVSTILVAFLLGDGARWPTVWLAVAVGFGVWWINGAHGMAHATAQRDLELQVVVMVGLFGAAGYRLRRHARSVLS